MKIAVTFFNSKKDRKIKNVGYYINKRIFKNAIREKVLDNSRRKIGSIYFSNTINSEHINIKASIITMVIILVFTYIFKVNIGLFIGCNIIEANNTAITKESFLALNNILNSTNFVLNKAENNYEDIAVINDNSEYERIDEVANNYSVVPTFSKISEDDIVITAENSTYQKINVCGIEVVNYSSNRAIDFVDIINSDDIFFSKRKDSILMYTTHTSESYANSEKYSFEYTSQARTTDGNYNMLAIASELAANLKSKGVSNICSITPHDYGEYNSAYINSRTTATALLRENPDVALSIDVHRDAIEDLSFAPKIEIRGVSVASLMFVMGIGYDDSPNEYYMDNLKLAFKIQLLANKVYPGLFRQMIIRNSVYNQDLNKYSFLVEVGATGNTIDEAKNSTRCLSNLINLLYKD